jgi:hypothetical protein
VLGQRLYESGELIGHDMEWRPNLSLIEELLHAKWTDPILGCMAYYAWRGALEEGVEGASEWMTHEAANNLLKYFGDLPDARLIAALEGLPEGPSLAHALDVGELPVLARTLREATYADEQPAAGLEHWASRVAPDTPWTLLWNADTSVAAAAASQPVTV